MEQENRFSGFSEEELSLLSGSLSLYVDRVLPRSYISTDEQIINEMLDEITKVGRNNGN